jgi:hypothetical protein
VCSLSWREWGHEQGKCKWQQNKGASNNVGLNRVFSLVFHDKLTLWFLNLIRLSGGAVSSYSLTYCIKFGKRLSKNSDFFPKSTDHTNITGGAEVKTRPPYLRLPATATHLSLETTWQLL